MFVHYGFGYIILNGVKIKVKWCEDLNLKSYTLSSQMKITHACTMLATVAHGALSGYLHKDLPSHWHSTENT